MTSYEIDVYVKNTNGVVVREHRLVVEATAWERIEVYVNDHTVYEDEGEDEA